MSYSDFTLAKVQQAFNLTLAESSSLFAAVADIKPSELLTTVLAENVPLLIAINSEKARSKFVIAPVVSEVRRQLNYQISVFSGTEFNVDANQGLIGFCDYIFSAFKEQYFINAPVTIIIEAKNENIIAGLGQCAAAMIAAQQFNPKSDKKIDQIYGVVTTGTTWKFLILSSTVLGIDPIEYYIKEIDKILAILMQPFQPAISISAL